MQPTPRIRVWSDRISWVLLFICFCRGLPENKEERPTCRDYIEISTHRTIFYHLEDSRSHGKEAEAEGGQVQFSSHMSGLHSWPGRPPPPRVGSGLFSRTMLHRPKGSRITVQPMSVWSNGPRSPEATIKPDPLAPRGDMFIIELRGALEGKPLL